ncbi:hypothetical protein T492DRAFT_965301 [Pavlovales sp. CCMP2436]|nr:hypothetical protein T492DRAFT_965301 [Pavlovales sp. CCMP2436]|mmetsp:Transcript_26539/g.61974  ORF Transcript_26539/g.61974 Transcript_26539/m.61974 type:complete len:208 (+) Transcript_26539:69-692(+)
MGLACTAGWFVDMADAFVVAYLLAHGVLALLVDVQSILPEISPALHARYQAWGLTAVVQDWGHGQGDFLVLDNPPWFKAFIYSELIFQVPACFVLAHAWFHCSSGAWLPSLMYSVHVLTSMPPIMMELCLDARPTLTCKLVYCVWLVFPAFMLARCLSTGPGGQLFEETACRAKARPPTVHYVTYVPAPERHLVTSSAKGKAGRKRL